ncbi:MAG TPA: hypothetical protein VFS65_00770 [Candidatus Saccharimonadales bacterium]|nr:hypothetical protein [Candidatus Saccharimonadales bacterium]
MALAENFTPSGDKVPENSPRSGYELLKKADIREPIKGREESYIPWEATPARIGDPDVVSHQSDVARQARDMLALVPSFITKQQMDFVEMIYLSREANRNVNNSHSYDNLLNADALSDDLQIADMYRRAELGLACPRELLTLMDSLGMGSIELAKLTHIYGHRLEFLDPMRKDIESTITLRGGIVYDDPNEEFEIIALDSGVTNKRGVTDSLAMKRKRAIGKIDKTVIFERTSFIVRIDEMSDFDQELSRKMRELDEALPESIRIKAMLWDGKLETEVKRLVDGDDLISTIPLSSTTYAFNPINRLALDVREEAEKAARIKRDEASMPETKRMRDMGAIAFFPSRS